MSVINDAQEEYLKIADVSEAALGSTGVKEPASQGNAPLPDEEVLQKPVSDEADVSEAALGLTSVKEPASQGSAPLPDEEVQQKPVSDEAGQTKETKVVAYQGSESDAEWSNRKILRKGEKAKVFVYRPGGGKKYLDAHEQEKWMKRFQYGTNFSNPAFESIIKWHLPKQGDVLDEEAEKLRSSKMSGWSWIPLDDDQVVPQRNNKNSSSSSSSNKIKSIYFCVRNFERSSRSFGFKWYAIGLKEEHGKYNSSSSFSLSLAIETMPPGVPNSFTAVAFGSRIYLIGGLSPHSVSHARVFYFDTAHPHQGWKEGPSMTTGRSDPSVVVVLGKIYVFGGIDIFDDDLPYAEVLDPTLDRWEVLPEPPHYLPKIVEPVHALLSDNCGNRRILIHPYQSMAFFSYNIDTRSWDVFDEWFRDNWSGSAVAVNSVLYSFVNSNIYAYDLLKRKRFTKPVSGFQSNKDSILPNPVPKGHEYPAYLFHIGGGKLCLFWSNMDHITANCTIFTVQRYDTLSGGEPDFVADIEAGTSYCHLYLGECTNCLAL